MDASEDLRKPYDSLLKQKKWSDYLTLLAGDGLTWWFNMEVP